MGFVADLINLSLLEAKCSPNSDRNQKKGGQRYPIFCMDDCSLSSSFPHVSTASFFLLISWAVWGPVP